MWLNNGYESCIDWRRIESGDVYYLVSLVRDWALWGLCLCTGDTHSQRVQSTVLPTHARPLQQDNNLTSYAAVRCCNIIYLFYTIFFLSSTFCLSVCHIVTALCANSLSIKSLHFLNCTLLLRYLYRIE